MTLAEMIDATPNGYGPDEAARGARLTVLEELSDDQLHKLLDLIQNEGLHRGFASWWWE